MPGSTDDAPPAASARQVDPANAADQSLQAAGKPTPSKLTPQERARCATLYLVRHGETEWNTQDILQGHLDSALTERGLAQARELVDRFRGVEFTAIFSSDVTRAQRTAQIIALDHQDQPDGTVRYGPFGLAAQSAKSVLRWVSDTGGWRPHKDVDAIGWDQR